MTAEELVAAVHRLIDTKDLQPGDPVTVSLQDGVEGTYSVEGADILSDSDGCTELHLIVYRF